MARESIQLDRGLVDVRFGGSHSSVLDRARARLDERQRHALALAAAREAGYRQGRADADAAFTGQLMSQRQEVAELADGVLRRLAEQQATLARQARGCVPALVMNIVRRLLANAVPGADRLERLIEQALAEAPADPTQSLEVVLSPGDLQRLETMGGDALRGRHPNLTLRADPALAPNDCLVRGDFGLIDARMEVKLKAVEGLLASS